MNLSRITLFTGMMLHFLVTISVILQQIVLVPIFSRYLSQELYSSWLIILSITTLIAIADLGLNPLSIVRLQSEIALNNKDKSEMLRRIVANSAYAYLVIFAIIIAIVPVFSFYFPIPSVFGLSGATDFDLRLTFLIAMLGSTATVLTVGVTAILRVTNYINLISGLRISTAVISTALIYLAISQGYGIVAVAVAYAVANIIEMVLLLFVAAPRALVEYGSFRFSMRSEKLQDTLRHARPNIIPISAEVVLQSIPTFMMGLVGTSPAGVVIYTLSRLILSSIRQVALTVMFPFSVPIGYAWAQGNREGAARIIVACLVIVGAGIGTGIGFFWSYRDAVVTIWTGGVYSSDTVVFGLLFTNIALAFPAIVAWHALVYIGQPVVVSRSKSLQIVMLCVLTAGLGSVFGVRGIAGSIFVSELVAVSIPLSLALVRRLPIGVFRFGTAVVLPLALMFTLSYVCAETAQYISPPSNIRTLVLGGCVWLPVPAATFLLIFYLSTKGSRLVANPATAK